MLISIAAWINGYIQEVWDNSSIRTELFYFHYFSNDAGMIREYGEYAGIPKQDKKTG